MNEIFKELATSLKAQSKYASSKFDLILMNIEEEVEKCEIYLKQIKQYDPDPFYVTHFFNQFILSINNIISGIFEEANIDFGLFVSQQISEQSFNEKAKKKNDENAIKFSTWFSSKFTEEHENPYPNSIKKICDFRKKFEKLPEIKIMIRASDRYKDDINQQIKVNLNQGKNSFKGRIRD